MKQQQHSTQALINKRFNLNLIIQGAAEYTSMNCHHLVRDQLNAINPELLTHYDRFGVAMRVNHWSSTNALVLGRPSKFWKNARKHGHVFANHPLLSRYGLPLNNEAKKHTYKRAAEVGVSRLPVVHSHQIMRLLRVCQKLEAGHEAELERLVAEVVHTIWSIPIHRLEPTLTITPAFGRLRPSTSFASEMMRQSAVGYSGVVRKGDSLQVVAKALTWPLLSHELVKGTVELICLHGINELDLGTYLDVTEVTDPIELEPWLLCVGAEFWRRMLEIFPKTKSHARAIMQIAMLDPEPLDEFMLAVVESPDLATQMIEEL